MMCNYTARMNRHYSAKLANYFDQNWRQQFYLNCPRIPCLVKWLFKLLPIIPIKYPDLKIITETVCNQQTMLSASVSASAAICFLETVGTERCNVGFFCWQSPCGLRTSHLKAKPFILSQWTVYLVQIWMRLMYIADVLQKIQPLSVVISLPIKANVRSSSYVAWAGVAQWLEHWFDPWWGHPVSSCLGLGNLAVSLALLLPTIGSMAAERRKGAPAETDRETSVYPETRYKEILLLNNFVNEGRYSVLF